MTIKVVSLNMWQGRLLDAILAFLQQEDADILTLQEVYDGKDPNFPAALRTLEIVQQQLKYPAFDFAPLAIQQREEGKVPMGNAIFSKFPIRGRDVQFFNEPFLDDYLDIPENYATCPRILQHAVLQTPQGELNVYNVHGVWDLDGDNFSERRRRMSDIIIESVKDKSRVLLAGDTNAKPTNQAMRAVEKQLKSVFGTSLKSTFNMRRKDNPGYATAAVDMLFVSPSFKILTKDCPDVDISDHLPLVAKLAIE